VLAASLTQRNLREAVRPGFLADPRIGPPCKWERVVAGLPVALRRSPASTGVFAHCDGPCRSSSPAATRVQCRRVDNFRFAAARALVMRATQLCAPLAPFFVSVDLRRFGVAPSRVAFWMRGARAASASKGDAGVRSTLGRIDRRRAALIATLGIGAALTALRCQSASSSAEKGGHAGTGAAAVVSGGASGSASGGGGSGGAISGGTVGATSGGGAGGTLQAGGTAGDAEPDVGPDASEAACKDCAQGRTSPCKSQFEACYGDVGCQNVLACTQACGLSAADAACANSCMASASATSKATFLQFHLCVFCATCKFGCKQYCEGLNSGGV
jgi:hypothetical protein